MPQDNTPLPQEDAQANPRDALNLKKAKIQILEGEFSDIDAALDAEFIEQLPSMLTEEEADMRLDEDFRPFLALVEEKKEGFYRTKLDELKAQIDALKKEASDEEESLDIEDGKRVFLEAHPEADWNALTEFYKNDMTARQKEDLIDLDLVPFMEKVYELFSKKNKKNPPEVPTKEEPNLPPNMNDAASSAPKGNPYAGAIDENYNRAIGLR